MKLMRWDAEKGILQKVYHPNDPNDWSGILWPGNATEPPTGVPRCGWNRELCKESKKNSAHNIAYGVPITLLVIVLGVLAVISLQHR